MEREPLTSFVYVSLSARDREALERIADERGATLSNVVRRLIRAATANDRPADIARAEQPTREAVHAAR